MTRHFLLSLAALLAFSGEAGAHAADRGFVLLLPTGYYLAGGAAAVAVTFLLLAVVPPGRLGGYARRRSPSGPAEAREPGSRAGDIASLLSFAFLAVIVAAGVVGSRDPLSNPLPLTVWTLWWVGLTILQGTVGNLWRWLNPWRGPHAAICAVLGRDPDADGPLRPPPGMAYWPAVPLFLAFALFELVSVAPDDPARLAVAVSAYWIATLVMMLLFGFRRWSAEGEPLTIFFAMLSRLALLDLDGRRPAVAVPGARLVSAPRLPPAGMLFLLLALASVSFDGLMRTFFWFGLNGLNPLEFEGRSSVVGINAAGLVGAAALLAATFLATVAIGDRLAGTGRREEGAARRLVWSIIPISLAFHFAHYLTAFLVNAQYALVAFSDPFWRGWNLFGTADMPVRAAIAGGHEGAWWVWNAQAGAIVLGHLLAVAVAHAIALEIYGDRRKAAISQVPLALLMIGYTIFGLWLLSTPTAG